MNLWEQVKCKWHRGGENVDLGTIYQEMSSQTYDDLDFIPGFTLNFKIENISNSLPCGHQWKSETFLSGGFKWRVQLIRGDMRESQSW